MQTFYETLTVHFNFIVSSRAVKYQFVYHQRAHINNSIIEHLKFIKILQFFKSLLKQPSNHSIMTHYAFQS